MAAPRVECVHDTRSALGEGAVWDVAERALYWVDIDGGLVHRFDPEAGPAEPVAIGEKVGCIVLRERGGAILGCESGLYTFDFATRARTLLADPEHDLPQNRFNDAATDRQGRWWVGSMDMASPRRPHGTFWRLDPDLTLTPWRSGFTITNGLAFSPDGRTMYFSDSHVDVRTIWSAPYDPDTGTPGEARVFFDTRKAAGRPDGATVDADGCYWMAGVAGSELVRLTPRGEVDMTVAMPVTRPSKPMFGGRDLSTLYVTSIGSHGGDPGGPQGGSLFAVTGLPAGGLPETRFGG